MDNLFAKTIYRATIDDHHHHKVSNGIQTFVRDLCVQFSTNVKLILISSTTANWTNQSSSSHQNDNDSSSLLFTPNTTTTAASATSSDTITSGVSSVISSASLHRYMKQIDCPHMTIVDNLFTTTVASSMSRLVTEVNRIQRDPASKGKFFQLIFDLDFSSTPIVNEHNITIIPNHHHNHQQHEQQQQQKFTQLVSFLSDFFVQTCTQCLPLLLLIHLANRGGGGDTQTLYQWSRQLVMDMAANNQSSVVDHNFEAIIYNNNANNKKKINKNDTNDRVIFIHPILDGCVRYDNVFRPKSRTEWNRLQTSYKQCNLNQTTVKVSISKILPYCNIDRLPNGQLVVHYAMETEMIKMMAKTFNFRIQIIDGRRVWGSLLSKNGTKSIWSGMLGQVLNYTSDVAMCEFTYIRARAMAIDYTRFIHQNQLTFMSHGPRLHEHFWVLTQPFMPSLWFAIIVSLFTVLTVLHCIYRHKPSVSVIRSSSSPMDGKSIEHFLQPRNNTDNDLKSILTDLFAITVQQSRNIYARTQNSSLRLIYGIWMLTMLTLSCSYSKSLYSFFTVPEYESPIDTVADVKRIAMQDRKYLIVKVGSSAWLNFVHSTEDNWVYNQIGKHINRTAMIAPQMTGTFADYMPTLIADHRLVAVSNRILLRVYRHQYQSRLLHIGNENLGIDYIGWILRKRSPLLKPFNMMIARMSQTGFIEKFIFNTFQRISPSAQLLDSCGYQYRMQNTNNLISFSLQNYHSLFLMWSFVVCISALVLGVELLYKHRIYARLRTYLFNP